tara:strand:- start:341 stop:586 length:246 start_codon:yes stop_codon:yes gene_type:complete
MLPKKYVVHKKVIAREFTMVDASSEEEAIKRVSLGEGKVININLEGAESLPSHTWNAELVPPKRKNRFEAAHGSAVDEYIL